MRKFKTVVNWIVFALIMICVVSIFSSAMEPPRSQCDTCGKMMVETGTVELDGGTRKEFQCPCGMHGTLWVTGTGKERWWEWSD